MSDDGFRTELEMDLEARCKRLVIELQGAAVALEEAGKLLNAATINGTPMTGTASLMTSHAERIRALPIDPDTGGE